MTKEKLKGEAREELTVMGGHDFDDVVLVNKYIDKATLAERKRCAEIIKKKLAQLDLLRISHCVALRQALRAIEKGSDDN